MRIMILAMLIGIAGCGATAMDEPTVVTGAWEIADPMGSCFIAAEYGSTTYLTVFSCTLFDGAEITRGNYRLDGDHMIVERTESSCAGIPRDAAGVFSVTGDVLSISRPPAKVVFIWQRIESVPNIHGIATGCWSDDGLTFVPAPIAPL